MSEQAGLPAGSVVGMVHLPPLPGAPGWEGSMDRVLERAVQDAWSLQDAGLTGVMVENFGDVPFYPGAVPPETVAAMAAAVAAVRAAVTLPVGVNVLRNDGAAALSVAVATGARFIRVNVHTGSMFTDQGLLHGQAHRTLRMRAHLGAPVAVLADVFVKHGAAPAGVSLEEAARDARTRGLADGLVVSGSGTGGATDPSHVVRVREAVPDAPVWVGSGATAESAPGLLAAAHGIIVGSALQVGGRAGQPVDPERARRFMDAVSAG